MYQKMWLDYGWQVSLVVDDDGHLNLYVNNFDSSAILEVDTGQGDGSPGEQLAIRLTTESIEERYNGVDS